MLVFLLKKAETELRFTNVTSTEKFWETVNLYTKTKSKHVTLTPCLKNLLLHQKKHMLKP